MDSPLPATPRKGSPQRRSRGHFASKCATTEARQRRLEAELKAAKRAAKDAVARQARIVGHAALRAVTNHPDAVFRCALVEWLRDTVTKPTERAEIAVLLIEGEGA
jgi:hypothetical protein